jgi:hypothetical protein
VNTRSLLDRGVLRHSLDDQVACYHTRGDSYFPGVALAPETDNSGNGVGLLHLNRFLRTFGAASNKQAPNYPMPVNNLDGIQEKPKG